MTARGHPPGRLNGVLRLERHLGVHPSLFNSGWMHTRAGACSLLPLLVCGGGGDEETRTPDPLLAKEMLCQLSYVPRPRKRGGRFWTRTRDLCLIRAAL